MRIYRDILRTSWHTLWRYAWLWPFGLVASFGGNGGEYGSLVSTVERLARQGSFLTALRESILSRDVALFGQGIARSLEQASGAILGALLVMAAVATLVIWLIIVAQAALIRSAGSLDEGKPASFTSAALTGAKYFWPIFTINVLAKFFTYLLLAVATLPFVISFLGGLGTANLDSLIIISFLIFVPLAIVISFVLKYAAIAVVLEGRSWWTALESAVNLFFRNWLVSLEMAGILFGVNLLLSAIVFGLTANTLLSLPLSLYVTNFSFVTFLRYLPPLLLVVAAGSWFSTFQYTAWTVLFRRLKRGEILPKLVRATDEIPNYIENWFAKVPAALPAPKTARRR